MTDHVISGLIRRRREIAGSINDLRAQMMALVADLQAIDRSLLLFDPSIEPHKIPALKVQAKDDWAAQGEISRVALAVLRDASSPLSTRSIAEMVCRQRGIDGPISTRHVKRVRKSLDRQRAHGRIERDYVSGYACWKLA